MQHRSGGQLERRAFDACPGLAQVSDVFGQLSVRGVFAVGAQNKTAHVARQRLDALAQLFALAGGNFLRHADVLVLRQEHQQPPGNADLRRQPGALGAHRILEHLHHQRLALEELLFNRLQRRHGWRARCARRVRFRLGMAAVDAAHQVGDMQKRRPVQADVDKGRLHARQHAHDFAQVHIADQAALQRALDLQLLHRAVLDHGDPGFLRRPINQDVLLHGFSRKKVKG